MDVVSTVNQINCKVVIAIGAAFDIYAGVISRAPRWMQLSCLEWFYRLLQNPKPALASVSGLQHTLPLVTAHGAIFHDLKDLRKRGRFRVPPGAQVLRSSELYSHQERVKMKLVESKTRVLVTGGGGFIGHHLVSRLKNEGYWVRSADLKYPEYRNFRRGRFSHSGPSRVEELCHGHRKHR